uniref:Uncharacterized protein n=1 Tax=Arundo donax TaxID=35708 RepID=A0A0A9AG57_ARUDO
MAKMVPVTFSKAQMVSALYTTWAYLGPPSC